MRDLISRQETLDRVCKLSTYYDTAYRKTTVSLNHVIDALQNLPSAEPERKGKWILSDAQQREDTENGNYQYFCSNCLYSDIHAKTVIVPFCWHCGAKMEE